MFKRCFSLSKKSLPNDSEDILLAMVDIVSLLTLAFKHRESLTAKVNQRIKFDTEEFRSKAVHPVGMQEGLSEIARLDGTILEIRDMLVEVQAGADLARSQPQEERDA